MPVLLLLAVTLPHLEQGDLRVETAHYAAIGLQAWQNPALFWTPHEHPAVCYFNKPPLVFWIHGLFLHFFGVTLTTARIPSILAAAGCILFTIGLVRRFSGPLIAMMSGCILAMTYEFFRRSREICLDMWQLLFMLAAVWIWVVTTQNRYRHLIWLAGVPLGLALMCKPLMAFMLLPILMVWLSLKQHNQSLPAPVFPHWALLSIAVTALLMALPWHASMVHLYGDTFTRQYFGHEVVDRLQGLRNREPLWYYGVEIGSTYWPWMLALILGLWRWQRGRLSQPHRQMLLLAAAWTGIWATALTLFPDKRPRYELPLYPMMAVIAAYGITPCAWRPLKRWYRHGLGITALIIVATGLLIHILPIRFQDPPEANITALVEWARKQNPAQVASASLTAIEESTLYLKAGYWPTPLRLLPKPLKPGTLLIYSAPFKWEPPSGTSPIFNQGPYHVIEVGSLKNK